MNIERRKKKATHTKSEKRHTQKKTTKKKKLKEKNEKAQNNEKENKNDANVHMYIFQSTNLGQGKIVQCLLLILLISCKHNTLMHTFHIYNNEKT